MQTTMGKKRVGTHIKLVAVVLFGMPFAVHAEDNFTALGTRSCGEWNRFSKDPQARMVLGNWILGFVSATAMFNSRIEGTDMLKKVNPEKLISYMDDYCQLNPAKTNVDGVKTIDFLLKKNPRSFD